jgi:uncharacterized protein YsxB (DUF464 family)
MTHVYLEQDGDRYTVGASGHATGSMEICAAVSTLLYSLAGFLHNSPSEILSEVLVPGEALLSFAGGDDDETVFSFMVIAFSQLEKSEPAHIKVEVKIIS